MLFAGNAYANNVAVKCELSILNNAHETLVYCGESIGPADETRYDKLSGDFSTFIGANANSKPRWFDSVEEIRGSLAQEGRDRACKGPIYEGLRRAFFYAVSDVGMAEVSALLSRPRDPSEGDCP